jgi:hypothetical protein
MATVTYYKAQVISVLEFFYGCNHLQAVDAGLFEDQPVELLRKIWAKSASLTAKRASANIGWLT